MRSVSADALRLLATHRWPGNVRQLENTIFRAVVLADGDEIGVDEIPQIGISPHDTPAVTAESLPTSAGHDLPPIASPPLGAITISDHAGWMPPGTAGSVPNQPGVLTMLNDGDIRPLEEIEAEVIRFAITHYRGQMSEVARKLQIGRSTLYRKLESLGLGQEAEPLTDVSGE